MIHSQLKEWRCQNKKIFLRADLNVPLQNGTILNDFRITSILPTLDFLLNKNNMVILATHIGRPNGYDETLSTKHLIPWFKDHNYTIIFAPTIKDLISIAFQPQQIILLENLRFFPGEQSADPLFAKQLAQTAQYYVNDAFASLHRNDCSISVLPYEFSENRRSIGFLVEKELTMLSALLYHSKRPFVAILGGKKISEKIPLIKNLLPIIDTLLLCPAICFSFLKALNRPVGTSLIDQAMLPLCQKITTMAESYHINVIYPQDYYITEHTINGPLLYNDTTDIPDNAIGISIGPKTIKQFAEKIHEAKTIFFNGAMGFAERPETRKSTYDLLHEIADSHGTSYVAGGDTVEAAFAAKVNHDIDHLSTGGGATLAYLSDHSLPGLMPFEES